MRLTNESKNLPTCKLFLESTSRNNWKILISLDFGNTAHNTKYYAEIAKSESFDCAR